MHFVTVNHEEQIKADKCTESLDLHDSRMFWKDVFNTGKSNTQNSVNIIADVTGAIYIAKMWKLHFSNNYNSLNDTVSKDKFNARTSSTVYTRTTFTVSDVYNAIRLQYRGKAVGPGGIASEAYFYGTLRLLEHITVLLNLCFNHNYLPCLLMESMLVRLVKNKNGNLCDVNNYRAIALSNSITKILESVMLPLIMKSDNSNKYQFGFKSGHSTAHCTKILKNVVNYYVDRDSHVFACFVDFSKAFDKVNHWKLFNFL